jgi:hypothetical protein
MMRITSGLLWLGAAVLAGVLDGAVLKAMGKRPSGGRDPIIQNSLASALFFSVSGLLVNNSQ